MFNKSNLDDDYLDSIKGKDTSIINSINSLIVMGILCVLAILVLDFYIKWKEINEEREYWYYS